MRKFSWPEEYRKYVAREGKSDVVVVVNYLTALGELSKEKSLWYPDLVRKAIYDPTWRKYTALGRKVAKKILILADTTTRCAKPKKCSCCKGKNLTFDNRGGIFYWYCQSCGECMPIKEFAHCIRCGELCSLHNEVCEPCIQVDAEDAMNYERIEEKYFN